MRGRSSGCCDAYSTSRSIIPKETAKGPEQYPSTGRQRLAELRDRLPTSFGVASPRVQTFAEETDDNMRSVLSLRDLQIQDPPPPNFRELFYRQKWKAAFWNWDGKQWKEADQQYKKLHPAPIMQIVGFLDPEEWKRARQKWLESPQRDFYDMEALIEATKRLSGKQNARKANFPRLYSCSRG